MPSQNKKSGQPRTFRADRLRWMREQLKLTQEQLNEMLGLGPTQVSRYETGVSEPLPDQLAKIAKILGCSTDWLLGLTDEPESYFHSPDVSRDEQLLLIRYRSGQFIEMARDLLSQTLVNKPESAEQPPDEGAN